MRTESDNEIISKWWLKVKGEHDTPMVGFSGMLWGRELELWRPAVYKAIEDAGLMEDMIKHFYAREMTVGYGALNIWQALSSTAAQKATALSRAIQEVG